MVEPVGIANLPNQRYVETSLIKWHRCDELLGE